MLRTGFAFCSLSGALCICSVCLFPHSWHPVRQSSSTLIESCVPMRGFYNTENVCEYSAPDSSRNLRLTHRTPSACCVPTTKYYLFIYYLGFLRSARIKVIFCEPKIVFGLYTRDFFNPSVTATLVSTMLLMQSQSYNQCCGAGAASFWWSQSRSRIAMRLRRLLLLNWYSTINCCLKVRLL
jgi:hypothetical protein